MLKTRVLTALVLAPLVLAAVWFASTPWVAGALAVVLSLGAAEWIQLLGVRKTWQRGAFVVGLWALILLGWAYYQNGLAAAPVLVPVGIGWLGALYWLQRYSQAGQLSPPSTAIGVLLGYAVLWPAWFSMVYLHGDGPWGPLFFIMLLFAVWGADIGAYFAGRAFGRHKLAPKVSPNKTWEGVAGGVVLALVVVALLHLAFGPGWPPLRVLLPLTLVTVLFSIVGDLFESMIKRQHDAKDSGTLLPGHGGVLDRIDSLTAAAPIFVLGLLWWRMLT